MKLKWMPRVLLTAVCTLAGPLGASASGRPVEVRTPHFVVFSDAGEAAARLTAVHVERVRATFAALWPWARVDPGAPVYVLVSKNASSLHGNGLPCSKGAGAAFQHGPERHYFFVCADTASTSIYQALFVGYANIVLGLNFGRLPLWLRIGVVQLFAGTLVATDAVEVGHPLQYFRWSSREAAPVSLSALLERKDTAGLSMKETLAFNGASWGFAHWLLIEQNLAGSRAAGWFLSKVAAGSDSMAALRAAGLNPKQVEAALRTYLRESSFRAIALPVRAEDAKAWSARALSSAEWDSVNAIFTVQFGGATAAPAAEARAREAVRQEPDLAVAREALARSLWPQKRLAEVREQMDAAVRLEPDRLSTRYLAGFVEKDLSESPQASGSEIGRGIEHLRRAVVLGPEFAPAQALLADMLLKKGDAPNEALDLAQRAATLEPSAAAHRLTLARALARGGDVAGARRECDNAVALSPDDWTRQQAERILASLGAQALDSVAPRP